VGPGLGSALAETFAKEGLAVALLARSEKAASAARDVIVEKGGTARVYACDASDPASVTSAFAGVQTDMGAPDVLLYNAGFFQIAGILEIAPAEFERAWRMNCFGALLVSQAVLPAMLERRRGTLLFTGASASLRGSARFATLAVGKFGLRALVQSMARELGPQGIHVAHVVVDGVIDTPRTRSMLAGREAPTMLAPAAIARTFWSLYAQDPTAWTHELDLRPSVEKF
jgi:NAD(P)-dependent dehydrogenase (short-subunit alcohol dehydrogenase family)